MVLVIQEIDENNVGDKFDEIIEQGPSVARFHMDGCGHCTAMESAWEATKNSLKDEGILEGAILNVNANSLPHIKHSFKKSVQGFPTILALDIDGTVLGEFKDPRETAHLKKFCHKHLKKQSKNTALQRGGKRKSRKARWKIKKARGQKIKKASVGVKENQENGGAANLRWVLVSQVLKLKKKKTGVGPLGKLLGAEEKEQYNVNGFKFNKKQAPEGSSDSSSSSCTIL